SSALRAAPPAAVSWSSSVALVDLVVSVLPVLLVDRMPVFQILEMMEGLLSVEDPDVLGLGRRKAADSPAQMNEVGFDGRVQRMHPDLAREVVRLARVAGAAGGDDVGPVVGAAA